MRRFLVVTTDCWPHTRCVPVQRMIHAHLCMVTSTARYVCASLTRRMATFGHAIRRIFGLKEGKHLYFKWVFFKVALEPISSRASVVTSSYKGPAKDSIEARTISSVTSLSEHLAIHLHYAHLGGSPPWSHKSFIFPQFHHHGAVSPAESGMAETHPSKFVAPLSCSCIL